MGIYRYTGSAQYVTVASTGMYDIIAFGAQGGSSSAGPFTGGFGAEIGGDLELTKGEKLEIVVGGSGGGNYSGGGGSFVLGSFGGSYVPLLIAGGGGGASYGANGGSGRTTLGDNISPNGSGGVANSGAGGSGVNSGGMDVFGTATPGGGMNITGNYAGGAAPAHPGGALIEKGGFGGGGAGDIYGGGGGGGYSGGYGGQGGAHFPAGGGGSFDIQPPIASETEAGFNASSGLIIIASVCFASGTLILTVRGNVAVDNLYVGDLAITTSGVPRPIRWLGHRTIDCRNHPKPRAVLPIRIAAHAFSPNHPRRDLFVSPAHSICVDLLGETLIPAGALVNGSTIVQVDVDSVTYWHVELDSHDVILAEDLTCESYLEMGNRTFFAGGGVVALNASLDARSPTHADFCRPFIDGGPLLEAVRVRLQERAVRLADCRSRDRDSNRIAC